LCPLPCPTTQWRCRVKRVIDVDTVVVQLDRGFWDASTKEIRFSVDGVERFSGTPEERARGKEAWEWLTSVAQGRWAYLYTSMATEKYGRILGDLHVLLDDGTRMAVTDEIRALGFEKAPPVITPQGAKP
jgi:endonuclease YncB( thermonuclease family)